MRGRFRKPEGQREQKLDSKENSSFREESDQRMRPVSPEIFVAAGVMDF